MAKNVKARKIALRIILIFVGLIVAIPVLYIGSILLASMLNPGESIKSEAEKLHSYIDSSSGTIEHTYDRRAGGLLGTVHSPSFEYYISYPHTATEDIIKTLARELEVQGYIVKTARFTPESNSRICSYYGFKEENIPLENRLISSHEYCRNHTGTGDPDLFGLTDNDQKAYSTLYAKKGEYYIKAEVSDKTFTSTANDFWDDDYAKKHRLESGRLPDGTSMLVIVIHRESKE